MSQLDEIRQYTELLSKTAKWEKSKEQILDIETIKTTKQKKEYVYEFYCFLRVISDLDKSYNIEIRNSNNNFLFPKAPASKINFPYFVAIDKESKIEIFEICTSIDIMGKAGETSAPDISFLHSNKTDNFNPTHDDVFMLFDAKFKHALSTKVHESEFNKVHSMVTNLDTADASVLKLVKFDKLIELNGNCLLTNSSAFKNNHDHHRLYNIKEIEFFDVDKDFNVIG